MGESLVPGAMDCIVVAGVEVEKGYLGHTQDIAAI